MARSRFIALLLAAAALVPLACVTPRGVTLEEKREHVRTMRDTALRDLLHANPAASQRLKQAAGYAVFNKLNLHVVVVGGGDGYGLARNNESGEEFFMRVAEGSVGFGAGVKSLRQFFVFHERTAFERFIEEGFSFGVEGEAAAVVDGETGVTASARAAHAGGSSGVSASGSVRGGARAGSVPASGFEVFQFTENGLMLQVNLSGARYWLDKKLN